VAKDKVAKDKEDDDDLLDDPEQAELWKTLQNLEEIAEEDPAQALAVFAALPSEVREIADFQLVHAGLLRSSGDLPAAERVLQALIALDHEDADAHHMLGDVLEDMGKLERALDHFLETLRLDSQASAEHSAEEVEGVLDATLEHLERTVKELPAEWRARLEGVPLLVQRLPSEDMVRAGLDPRALGLFDGPMHAEAEGIDCAPAPTRIVLFAENLALDFPDADEFKDQVRITVLHELGHYFGLDEDDMERLGLD